MGIFRSTGRKLGSVGKATIKAPAFLFRGLFGRDFLGRDLTQQTKDNVSSLKQTISQFKDLKKPKAIEVKKEKIDTQSFDQAFYNITLTSYVIGGMLIWTVTRFIHTTQLQDFLAQLCYSILLGVFYLALSRCAYKARLMHKALPKTLSDEDQIVTWGKYFSAVVDKPSLLLPLKLSK